MKTQYGRGPWASDEAEHDCPLQNITIRDALGSSICRVFIDDAPVLDYNSRQMANKKLILAAPAMAELLNSISNWLVCSAIATPEDMAQSFAPFQQEIDRLLVKAGCQ